MVANLSVPVMLPIVQTWADLAIPAESLWGMRA
jgi:hypothetical protein